MIWCVSWRPGALVLIADRFLPHEQVLNKQAAAEPAEEIEPELTEEEKKEAEEKKKQDSKSSKQKAAEWFAGGEKK
jgi:hypothetical protein